MLHICDCSLFANDQTLEPSTHTHHINPHLRTHTQAQPTTSMTSACLGYNHSGNSNYIIERVAARGTLLITQCFQLLEAALLHIYWSSKAWTLLLGFIKMGQLINTAINRFTAKMNGDWKSLAVGPLHQKNLTPPTQKLTHSGPSCLWLIFNLMHFEIKYTRG